MARGRWAIVGFVTVDVIALAVFVVLLVQKMSRTAVLDIYVAPSTAKVVINGEEYRNGEAYDIYPGKLDVVIENDGLTAKSFSVIAESNRITKVYNYLTDENGGFGWYKENLGEMQTLERVAHGAADEFIAKMSILDILPYKYVAYDEEKQQYVKFIVEIDRLDCPDRFCLQVLNISESTNEFVKNKVEERGYDLNNYEVYYY